MSDHLALENAGTDIGDLWWFKTIVGVLWVLVAVLLAVGLYSVAPTTAGNLPALLAVPVVFIGLLFAVTAFLSRRFGVEYRGKSQL